jgi:hypothetical protein
MRTYELTYKFLFNWAGFSAVKAKGSSTFRAKDDKHAKARARAIISDKNRKRGNGEYDFVLIRLVRIVE